MISPEAQKLAEAFLKDKKIDEPEAKEAKNVETNLLIGIPAFGGQIHTTTATLLLDLAKILPFPHTTYFLAGESLITRGRNHIASVAAFTKDGVGRDFSHCLFLDSDISFWPEYVLQMLNAQLPIVGLPCTLKRLNLKFVAEAAKRGIGPEHLAGFAGIANFAAEQSFEIADNKPVPAHYVGTGVMLIQTEVLKALAKAHPERRYRPNCDFGARCLEFHHDFFRVGVRRETYMSEDFQLCEDAAELGFGTYILPAAKTTHHGSFSYEMDLSKVSAVAEAIARDELRAVVAKSAEEKTT